MVRIFWALQFVFYLIFRIFAQSHIYACISSREVFLGQYAAVNLWIELAFVGLMLLGGLYSLRFRYLSISREGVFGNFLMAGVTAIEIFPHVRCITLF